jgi:predicted ATP-grasp superfamily ATP-dependent carboligase
VRAALDKFRTIELGQSVGVPCPRTWLYESPEQIAEVVARERFPLVVKPRFTSGSRGMAVVRTRGELDAVLPAIVRAHGAPLVQEYIPGGDRSSVQVVVDRCGRIVFAFHKLRSRKFRRTARLATVSESVAPDARVLQLAGLISRVGWWGAMGIETIRDPRDGLDKLMEINPRFPRQLWNRTELGINEPLMCVRIARGEPVEPVPACAAGIMFVSPVEDVMLLALQLIDSAVYAVRMAAGGAPLDPHSAPPPVGAELRRFARTYASRQRKVWDPYSRYLLQDPLASLLWWMQFATWIAGSWRQVGR